MLFRSTLRSNALFTTLVAGAAQHLFVLLLAHPLATLLDQGTHKASHDIGRARENENPLP